MQDILTIATNLVREIDALELQLRQKKDELRAVVGGPAPKAKRRAPKPRRGISGVNISASVRRFVEDNPGTTVPRIVAALHFKEHEGTVRAVLKKAKKAGTMINYKGTWALAVPKTQETPRVSPTNGVTADDDALGTPRCLKCGAPGRYVPLWDECLCYDCEPATAR